MWGKEKSLHKSRWTWMDLWIPRQTTGAYVRGELRDGLKREPWDVEEREPPGYRKKVSQNHSSKGT